MIANVRRRCISAAFIVEMLRVKLFLFVCLSDSMAWPAKKIHGEFRKMRPLRRGNGRGSRKNLARLRRERVVGHFHGANIRQTEGSINCGRGGGSAQNKSAL